MKNLYKLLFLSILIIAIFFRFYRLSNLPSSLNWDEISHGYNAYSILKTGNDQWGKKLPIFNFRAYGDFPTTLNVYLTIPFVKLFGLNALTIRLPSAIFGVLFVILNYYFALLIFESIPLALFCMLLAAVNPWTLFPSRAVFQSNFSQTLLLAGISFFIAGIKRPRLYIFSALCLSLSLYAYHNTRIIVPVLIPFLIFYYRAQLHKILQQHRFLLTGSLFIFLIIALPNLINLFSADSFARNRWVGIINPNSINIINEHRRLYTGPSIFNRLINNRVLYFAQTFTINYLQLLNPAPLFFNGSQNYQFNIPNTGLLFLCLLPFFYCGLGTAIFKHKKSNKYLFLLIIFIICLLPAALTVGDFPSIRASSAIPLYFLFTVIGIKIFPLKLKWPLSVLVAVILIIEFINFWAKYLQYNQQYSFAWQYGYQQTVEFLKSNYNQYTQIAFTKKYGEPHEFILFYWPWDPHTYQNDSRLKWNFHSDWYWVDAFDKFTFINDWEIKNNTFPSHTLLITSPDNYPSAHSTKVKTIYFLDNTPAFDIVAYD